MSLSASCWTRRGSDDLLDVWIHGWVADILGKRCSPMVLLWAKAMNEAEAKVKAKKVWHNCNNGAAIKADHFACEECIATALLEVVREEREACVRRINLWVDDHGPLGGSGDAIDAIRGGSSDG